MTAVIHVSRRVFLAAVGAIGAGLMVGCGRGSGSGSSASSTSVQMFRRSTKTSRASRAAKEHAANMRYATAAAALADKAHPGDNARVVPLDVSQALFDTYFGGGATSVDLRKI